MSAKLLPSQVLYIDDGGPKTCSRCMMFISDTQECMIHDGAKFHAAAQAARLPEGQLVCYLYVHGDPHRSGVAKEFVTPKESGLGFGGTSCGSCEYGNGRRRCAHPALSGFPISNEGGCCNAWESIDPLKDNLRALGKR